MTKATYKDKVLADLDILKNMSYPELVEHGKKIGANSIAGFSAYKKALENYGIDFEKMKKERKEKKENELIEKAGRNELTLITDAYFKKNRFAVCDEAGNPLWYGSFFDDEPQDQADAELKAALKAVWLAGKIKELKNISGMTLKIKTDAEYLKYQDHKGQKGYALTVACQKKGIVLEIEHIKSAENPADYYSRCEGFMKWQENKDIISLVKC